MLMFPSLNNGKGQAAIEFALGLSILFFLFLTFITAITSRSLDNAKESIDESSKFVADTIINEVTLAKTMESGYSRTFSIPRYISGLKYDFTTEFGNLNDNLTIITLVFPDYNNYEYPFILQMHIKSDSNGFAVGQNNISKIGDFVKVN